MNSSFRAGWVRRATVALTCALTSWGWLTPTHAWEPDTTNAGLTLRAAESAGFHDALVSSLGLAWGRFTPLAVSKTTASALGDKLGRVDPMLGVTPDAKQRLTAQGWLLAGAVLEEMPGDRSANHFFDPTRTGAAGKGGLIDARGLMARTSSSLSGGRGATQGMAAPAWLESRDNELGLLRFLTELESAATAPTPAAREQHTAFALVCAGAMLAVLQDMASPSRVRNDLSAHLMPVGSEGRDRGARLERLAALVYGRGGLPPATTAMDRPTLHDFFSAKDGQGLADVVAQGFYSYGTLPGPLVLDVKDAPAIRAAALRNTLARALPAPGPLDLDAVSQPNGSIERGPGGVCRAVQLRRGTQIEWVVTDACATEQLAWLLPRAAEYSAGLLKWLLRGALTADDGQVFALHVDVKEGSLRFFAENASGQRSPLGAPLVVGALPKGQALAAVPSVPTGTNRVVAVFTGKDSLGQPLVGVGVWSATLAGE